MIVLKIIGIALAVLVLFIGILLCLRLKLFLGYKKEKGFSFRIGILFLKFGGQKKKKAPEKKELTDSASAPKKEKKKSRFIEKLKKKFGLDFLDNEDLKQNVEEKGISNLVNKIVTIITLLLGQIKWLLSKFRLEKLRIFAVCSGDDAADAAMDYGLVCSTVYPIVGYIMANVNAKDNAEEILIGCDFDGNTDFEFDFNVSVRIFYIVSALLRSMSNMAAAAEQNTKTEENNE